MGFKAVRAARVPLGLEGLDDEDVVADELENDVLQRRFKMILTIDLLLSMLIDKEQMERLLRNIANMFWIKLLGGEDENNVQFFLNNFFRVYFIMFFRDSYFSFCCCSFFVVKFTFSKRSSKIFL